MLHRKSSAQLGKTERKDNNTNDESEEGFPNDLYNCRLGVGLVSKFWTVNKSMLTVSLHNNLFTWANR